MKRILWYLVIAASGVLSVGWFWLWGNILWYEYTYPKYWDKSGIFFAIGVIAFYIVVFGAIKSQESWGFALVTTVFTHLTILAALCALAFGAMLAEQNPNLARAIEFVVVVTSFALAAGGAIGLGVYGLLLKLKHSRQ